MNCARPGVIKLTLMTTFLQVLCACLIASATESDVSAYSNEVLDDHPVYFFPFVESDLKSVTKFRNLSQVKQRGPDSVSFEAVNLILGPVGLGGFAAEFDGKNYLEIPHDDVFDTKERSVEFWFRTNQVWNQKYWPGSATLVSKFTAGWASSDWGILGGSLTSGVNEGRILVGVGPQGGGDVVLASGKGLNDGRYHHVVWTRSAEGRNVLYVDGTSCASTKDSGGIITNLRPIQIGGEQREPNGTFFKGQLAAIAIYSHVLLEERVRLHFAAGSLDPRLPAPSERTVDFVRDIKPIFQQHCYKCHGPGKDQGGLSLATRSLALDGGDNGLAMQVGKSALSPLVHRIAGLDDGTVMPPEGDQLTSEQVGIIRAWIDQGLVWPSAADELDPRVVQAVDHWSFKPLKHPLIPAVKSGSEDLRSITSVDPSEVSRKKEWGNTPVDAFILAKLHEAKLSPAAPTTKSALLRRVSFDLTGLPPTPAEIDAFINDPRSEAFSIVVDRLLASPAYGERWARHWLDIVRYADSGGYETDIFYEQAWRYRDYVIRSFNEDKPYDQFLMEQVAGDELWPDQAETFKDAIAVWTLGQWPNSLDKFPELLEYTRRTDQVTTFGEAMLGLTVGCANCHNHKYDPISQRDYFGLEAIFAASETWDQNTKKKAWASGERNHFRVLRHSSSPTEIRFLARGELTKPRGIVSPTIPAFLPGGGPISNDANESQQRRAHLARWLVSPQNPLTARVIANRVWQWHFGQALAATPNDLGTRGHPPSHPELLDWLATELVENGWSLKKLHRLLLLSSTYQQSTHRNSRMPDIDPQNVWLSHFPRRRLEAEEVWDHLHSAAGTLVTTHFGSPFIPQLSAEELKGLYDIEQKPDKKWPVTEVQNRRAIYVLNRRSFRFPFFEAFDPPNSGASCPTRQATTVPAQALTLLNNGIVSRQAKAMSERLVREAGENRSDQVRLAWLLAYSRQVTEPELEVALQFLAEAKLAHQQQGTPDPAATALNEFCLGLMNTSEFIGTN